MVNHKVHTIVSKIKHWVTDHSWVVISARAEPPIARAFEYRKLELGMVTHTMHTLILKANNWLRTDGSDNSPVKADPAVTPAFEDRKLRLGMGAQ